MSNKPGNITVASINIEGDNHLSRVAEFTDRMKPDVLCLQEVFEVDMPELQRSTGMSHAYFVPGMNVLQEKFNLAAKGIQGIAIMCHSPQVQPRFGHQYYFGSAQVNVFNEANDASRAVAWVQIVVDGVQHVVTTTHFTWSPDGKTIDLQIDTIEKMLSILQQFPSLILCGDMNAPRQGHEAWRRLASMYSDTIPPEVQTTLTPLHRVHAQFHQPVPQFVVDGMFTTADYRCFGTQLDYAVSDHAALFSTLLKE